MKSRITKTLLLVVATTALNAQDKPSPSAQGAGKSTTDANCGMVYGKDHAFLVCAPKGWTLDNTIGYKDGIYAAFYPDNQSWSSARESGTVMYVNTAAKTGDNATVAGLIATDAENTKRHAPASVVKACEPIKLKSPEESAAPVQCFAPGGFNRFEAVAYIDSPKIITMFVMTSKNEQSFKRDYPVFVTLVQSYSFFSSNVTFQHQ